MLTPYDDFPIHQTPLPIAHAGDGHADFYDRFWFNGYAEDFYFAVAMGLYPNRGVIDAAFSVVHDGVQRSVFASGRIPADRTETRIGPLSIEIVEPLRINRVRVDAPEQQLTADLTWTSRTAAYEEPRQTRYAGTRLAMDVTRATSLGTWDGSIESGGHPVPLDAVVYGTKDRSWGIRPVGLPAPAAPEPTIPQIFFLWAPINFDDVALHYLVFEDGAGVPWSETAAVLPVAAGADAEPIRVTHDIDWAPGLRRSEAARLNLAGGDTVELTPLLTFRMSGAGYFHPTYSHGRWHGELVVDGAANPVEDLDNLEFSNIHVQQVMRAQWGNRSGLGVLEQLVIGPHAPSGFRELLDGASGR